MWGKLWLHESERVYADRLVSQQVSTCTIARFLIVQNTLQVQALNALNSIGCS